MSELSTDSTDSIIQAYFEQKNILGFEHEDIIYIVIPITFFNKIDIFLLCSFIGTPIFLFITIFIFINKTKNL